ncbi:PPC domain-containing protein [uncultured Microbulbifer sp.]|uniref:PPC domain-containing protein n=1 Tax=uncultured Microbulbifer sp. TaxID=348147 RepID=UPI0026337FC9|nr:PPC domain-containing protein [uncultured Microbulbifer sp.]
MKRIYQSNLFANLLICLAFVCMSGAARSDESRTETLQFAKGATGTSVSSNITGYNTVNYKVTAKAGQRMVVKLSTPHTATYFNVYAPGSGPGDAAIFIGSTSGERFATTLPDSGTYTIQVYMMRSAARREESADFKLRVDIDNGKSSHSGSEKSGGRIAWKYDASGNLPCSAGEPSFRRECPFQVKRAPGAAEIRTRKPVQEHGQRVLYFANDRFSTDDGTPLNWQRQGDNWWLAAGSQEYYLIPDAVIYGG